MQALSEPDTDGKLGMIVKRVSVPIGLEELMEGLTKEVLLRKPKDLYVFASEYFSRLVILRERSSNHKAYSIRTVQSVTHLKTPLSTVKGPKTAPARPTIELLSKQNQAPDLPIEIKAQSEPIRSVIQKSRGRSTKQVAQKQQNAAKEAPSARRERSSSRKASLTPRSISSVQSTATPREKRQKSNPRPSANNLKVKNDKNDVSNQNRATKKESEKVLMDSDVLAASTNVQDVVGAQEMQNKDTNNEKTGAEKLPKREEDIEKIVATAAEATDAVVATKSVEENGLLVAKSLKTVEDLPVKIMEPHLDEKVPEDSSDDAPEIKEEIRKEGQDQTAKGPKGNQTSDANDDDDQRNTKEVDKSSINKDIDTLQDGVKQDNVDKGQTNETNNKELKNIDKEEKGDEIALKEEQADKMNEEQEITNTKAEGVVAPKPKEVVNIKMQRTSGSDDLLIVSISENAEPSLASTDGQSDSSMKGAHLGITSTEPRVAQKYQFFRENKELGSKESADLMSHKDQSDKENSAHEPSGGDNDVANKLLALGRVDSPIKKSINSFLSSEQQHVFKASESVAAGAKLSLKNAESVAANADAYNANVELEPNGECAKSEGQVKAQLKTTESLIAADIDPSMFQLDNANAELAPVINKDFAKNEGEAKPLRKDTESIIAASADPVKPQLEPTINEKNIKSEEEDKPQLKTTESIIAANADPSKFQLDNTSAELEPIISAESAKSGEEAKPQLKATQSIIAANAEVVKATESVAASAKPPLKTTESIIAAGANLLEAIINTESAKHEEEAKPLLKSTESIIAANADPSKPQLKPIISAESAKQHEEEGKPPLKATESVAADAKPPLKTTESVIAADADLSKLQLDNANAELEAIINPESAKHEEESKPLLKATESIIVANADASKFQLDNANAELRPIRNEESAESQDEAKPQLTITESIIAASADPSKPQLEPIISAESAKSEEEAKPQLKTRETIIAANAEPPKFQLDNVNAELKPTLNEESAKSPEEAEPQLKTTESIVAANADPSKPQLVSSEKGAKTEEEAKALLKTTEPIIAASADPSKPQLEPIINEESAKREEEDKPPLKTTESIIAANADSSTFQLLEPIFNGKSPKSQEEDTPPLKTSESIIATSADTPDPSKPQLDKEVIKANGELEPIISAESAKSEEEDKPQLKATEPIIAANAQLDNEELLTANAELKLASEERAKSEEALTSSEIMPKNDDKLDKKLLNSFISNEQKHVFKAVESVSKAAEADSTMTQLRNEAGDKKEETFMSSLEDSPKSAVVQLTRGSEVSVESNLTDIIADHKPQIEEILRGINETTSSSEPNDSSGSSNNLKLIIKETDSSTTNNMSSQELDSSSKSERFRHKRSVTGDEIEDIVSYVEKEQKQPSMSFGTKTSSDEADEQNDDVLDNNSKEEEGASMKLQVEDQTNGNISTIIAEKKQPQSVADLLKGNDSLAVLEEATEGDHAPQSEDTKTDMSSLESVEGVKGVSKESTFIKQEADAKAIRRPKIGDIDQVASVIEVPKNIDNVTDDDDNNFAAVREGLNKFLQNEQRHVFQNQQHQQQSLLEDDNKKVKQSKLTAFKSKRERTLSHTKINEKNGATPTNTNNEVKIRRARSVGVIKTKDIVEAKSKIPTATRRSAGRRPLVRQLEADSKELEEKLSFKRPSGSRGSKEDAPKDSEMRVNKEDVLIAKTILAGVEGAEKHIELIEEHLKKKLDNIDDKSKEDMPDKRDNAATNIQKTWKGFNVRRNLEENKKSKLSGPKEDTLTENIDNDIESQGKINEDIGAVEKTPEDEAPVVNIKDVDSQLIKVDGANKEKAVVERAIERRDIEANQCEDQEENRIGANGEVVNQINAGEVAKTEVKTNEAEETRIKTNEDVDQKTDIESSKTGNSETLFIADPEKRVDIRENKDQTTDVEARKIKVLEALVNDDLETKKSKDQKTYVLSNDIKETKMPLNGSVKGVEAKENMDQKTVIESNETQGSETSIADPEKSVEVIENNDQKSYDEANKIKVSKTLINDPEKEVVEGKTNNTAQKTAAVEANEIKNSETRSINDSRTGVEAKDNEGQKTDIDINKTGGSETFIIADSEKRVEGKENKYQKTNVETNKINPSETSINDSRKDVKAQEDKDQKTYVERNTTKKSETFIEDPEKGVEARKYTDQKTNVESNNTKEAAMLINDSERGIEAKEYKGQKTVVEIKEAKESEAAAEDKQNKDSSETDLKAQETEETETAIVKAKETDVATNQNEESPKKADQNEEKGAIFEITQPNKDDEPSDIRKNDLERFVDDHTIIEEKTNNIDDNKEEDRRRNRETETNNNSVDAKAKKDRETLIEDLEQHFDTKNVDVKAKAVGDKERDNKMEDIEKESNIKKDDAKVRSIAAKEHHEESKDADDLERVVGKVAVQANESQGAIKEEIETNQIQAKKPQVKEGEAITKSINNGEEKGNQNEDLEDDNQIQDIEEMTEGGANIEGNNKEANVEAGFELNNGNTGAEVHDGGEDRGKITDTNQIIENDLDEVRNKGVDVHRGEDPGNLTEGFNEEKAAIKIQSAWKGFVVRKMMKSSTQLKNARDEAITKIQAVVRGFLERLKYDKLKSDGHVKAGATDLEDTKGKKQEVTSSKVDTTGEQCAGEEGEVENEGGVSDDAAKFGGNHDGDVNDISTKAIGEDDAVANKESIKDVPNINQVNTGDKTVSKNMKATEASFEGQSVGGTAPNESKIHQPNAVDLNVDHQHSSNEEKVPSNSINNSKPDFYRSNTVVEPALIKKSIQQLGEDTIGLQPPKDDNNNSNNKEEETELERDIRTAVRDIVKNKDKRTPLEREISEAVKHIMENNHVGPTEVDIDAILKHLPEVPREEALKKEKVDASKPSGVDEHEEMMMTNASLEMPASNSSVDDLSSIGSVDSVVTVVLKPKSGGTHQRKHHQDFEQLKNDDEDLKKPAYSSRRLLGNKALSTSALEDHVELIDQVQNSLLDQLSGKTSSNKKFDIEQLRKELHDAATLYNNDEASSSSVTDHDDEVMKYLYDEFQPEDPQEEAQQEYRSRTPLRELPDIAEEDDSDARSFCKTPSLAVVTNKHHQKKVVDGKPLEDLVEVIHPPKPTITLLHTSELHDSVILPADSVHTFVDDDVDSSSFTVKELNNGKNLLKHTSEFHDSVVVPLPISGADLKIKEASKLILPGSTTALSQAGSVDSGNGNNLKHTSEFHDTVMMSLPSGADVKIKNASEAILPKSTMAPSLVGSMDTRRKELNGSNLKHTSEFHDTVVVPLPISDADVKSKEASKIILPITAPNQQDSGEDLNGISNLKHTSEFHDTVVLPLSSGVDLKVKQDASKVILPESTMAPSRDSGEALSGSNSLKHTSEFHDTVVLPLPISDGASKVILPESTTGPSQAVLMDGGNQTSTQQAPAGVEVVTSRRRRRQPPRDDGVEFGGAQASLKDGSRAKPETVGSFAPQSPERDMESETNNNNKRNNAISSSAEKNMEAQAATKIQAGFRGYQVRKQLKAKNTPSDQKRQLRKRSSRENMKAEELEEKSAVKIQAGVRGFLVRRRQKKQVNSCASA